MDHTENASWAEEYPARAGFPSNEQDCTHHEIAAAVTVFSTSDETRLSKSFRLEEGRICKTAQAKLRSGNAQVTQVSTAAALAGLLTKLKSNQALSIGRLAVGIRAVITSRNKATSGAITRTKDNFVFTFGPGWLLIDFDGGDLPPEVAERLETAGGAWAMLVTLWPELANAAYVHRPSASQGVGATGCTPLKSGGMHFYVRLADMTKAKATLDALHSRAWAHGFGFIKLSKSGATLPRSIVDVAVASPERLVFEAAPFLGAGVSRHAPSTEAREGLSMAPLVNPKELEEAARAAQGAARRAIKPTAKRMELAFVDRRAVSLARAENITKKKARALVRERIKGGLLADTDVIDGPNGEALRVGDVLDDPGKWHMRGIPDPVEGQAYGSDKATLFLRPRPENGNEQPALVSHAHGVRTVYRFERYKPKPQSVPLAYPQRGEAVDTGAPKHRTAIYDFISSVTTEARAAKDRPAAHMAQGGRGQRMALSGAQGIGKTRAAVTALAKAEGLVVLFLLPTQEMARQAFADYDVTRVKAAAKDVKSPVPLLWRGRGAAVNAGAKVTMCQVADEANHIAKAGGDVRLALCNVCPLRLACPYLEQVRQASQLIRSGEGMVIFGAHQLAGETLPAGIVPDLVIYDERPANSLVATSTLPIEAFGRERMLDRARPPQELAAAGGHLRDCRKLEMDVCKAFQGSPGRELGALRNAGWTADRVRDVVANLFAFEKRMLEATVRKAVDEGAIEPRDYDKSKMSTVRCKVAAVLQSINPGETEARTMHAILCVVAVELASGKIGINSLKVDIDRKISAQAMSRPNFPVKTAVLVLDGTGNKLINEAMFGPLENVHIPVERNERTYVVHVTGKSCSRQSITGIMANGEAFTGKRAGEAEHFRSDLAGAIGRYPGAFVAASKGVLAALAPLLPSDTVTANFGALRGLNRAANCKVGFVIGRELVPPTVVEDIARALFARDPTPIEVIPHGEPWPTRSRGIRMRDGSSVDTECEFHPDPRCNAVLEQIREAEIVQGLDRTRPMFNERQLFIISNVPTDVTVDKVMSWADFKAGGSRVDRALATHRMVPLSPREAVRVMPQIWSNKRTAARDLALFDPQQHLGRIPKRNFCLANAPNVSDGRAAAFGVLVRYRVEGKYAHEHEAYVIAPPKGARAFCEAMMGPLAAFEVVEVNTRPKAGQLAANTAEEVVERASIAEDDGGLSREGTVQLAREEPKHPPAAAMPFPPPQAPAPSWRARGGSAP